MIIPSNLGKSFFSVSTHLSRDGTKSTKKRQLRNFPTCLLHKYFPRNVKVQRHIQINVQYRCFNNFYLCTLYAMWLGPPKVFFQFYNSRSDFSLGDSSRVWSEKNAICVIAETANIKTNMKYSLHPNFSLNPSFH